MERYVACNHCGGFGGNDGAGDVSAQGITFGRGLGSEEWMSIHHLDGESDQDMDGEVGAPSVRISTTGSS